MESAAERCFQDGDLKGAACLYSNLMVLHPQYTKMARVCRVLSSPLDVPLPYRYADVVEALLEPSLTHRTLFGADAQTSTVRKAFQAWTLLVHPDKNPYPKAADAFNRLVAFKAAAMGVLGAGEGDAGGARSEATCKGDTEGYRRNVKRQNLTNKLVRSDLRSRLGAEIDLSLYELKKVQVTLKSLKRKNVDDSELPPLSAFIRPAGAQRPHAGSADHHESPEPCVSAPGAGGSSLDSFAGFSPTSTQSGTPDAIYETELSRTIKARPQSSGGAQEVCPTLAGMEPQQTVECRESSVEGSVDGQSEQPNGSVNLQQNVTHEGVEEVMEKLRVAPEVRDPAREVPQIIPQSNNAPRKKVDGVSVSECVRSKECASKGISSSIDGTFLSVGIPKVSRSPIADGDVSPVDLAKLGIRELFDGIQKRINREPLRLNCDLSFAAYAREKKEMNKMPARTTGEA